MPLVISFFFYPLTQYGSIGWRDIPQKTANMKWVCVCVCVIANACVAWTSVGLLTVTPDPNNARGTFFCAHSHRWGFLGWGFCVCMPTNLLIWARKYGCRPQTEVGLAIVTLTLRMRTELFLCPQTQVGLSGLGLLRMYADKSQTIPNNSVLVVSV